MALSVSVIKELDIRFAPYGRHVAYSYGWALFLGFIVFLATQSIQYIDTDLWYHLHGGRHLFEQGNFYNPISDSYLVTESRSGPIYFWGFQALVYLIWSYAGEFGLVVLKAAGLSLAGFFAVRVVLQNRLLSDATFLQLIVITAVIGILASRGFNLRPHIASYIMIGVFTYILGNREKLYPLLPILTVLWVNLHGVEYIVGALICGAFFLQRLINWLETDRPADGFMPLLWIASCAPAMLINPVGYQLIAAPFMHSPDLHRFIAELKPFELKLIVDLQEGLPVNALLLSLLGLAAYSALVCLGQYRKHLAALILAVGGLILLMRAQRFLWEWMLLTLPLISAGLGYQKNIKHGALSTAVLTLTLFGLALTYVPVIQQGLRHYPFDANSLPLGTTEFIQVNGITGRYAIEPSFAGYVEFMLSPDVKVHMDMQFPPFNSEDIHEISWALRSDAGLRSYVERYEPDMLGPQKDMDSFPSSTAKELGYAPVFFDRQVILYLHRESFPEVASEYELTVVNPFAPKTFRVDKIDQAILELNRMQQVIDSPEVKQTLIDLFLAQGDLIQARILRNELLLEDPHHPSTLLLSARVDHMSGNCENALESYEKAISLTQGDATPIRRFAAECYFVVKDISAAYEQFSQSLNPYADPNPSKLQYYQFALSAIGVGDEVYAHRLLTMLEDLDTDGEFTDRISDVRSAIAVE